MNAAPGDNFASKPISDYALLSDCQGAALVSRDGSIEWACQPRFDSPAAFARILDPEAGHWRISPLAPYEVEREYLPETMVLRTQFRTRAGVATLTDAMALGAQDMGHRIGRSSPHVIVRRVECLEGEVELDLEFVLRPEYGLTLPIMVAVADGLRARGGAQAYRLVSDVTLDVADTAARARFRLHRGEAAAFALALESPWEPEGSPRHNVSDVPVLLDATVASWKSWSKLHQSYDGPYADLVCHSGRVLQALTYAPTGAVVAAPTTSLPETPGGDRNWDYRYCWVRDASLTLEALWVAACPHEAGRFFDFLATAGGSALSEDTDLQILFGVGGERLLPEYELAHLAGHAGSRPVRVGNGAWSQTQLDVYGELLNAAWVLADVVGSFDAVTARFLAAAADAAATRWRAPDQGIWEIRGEPRHFVHSKLMCWVALDRALRLGARLGTNVPTARWQQERDAIRAEIETRGWSTKAGAFAQAFDRDELDASTLLLLVTGFLPPDDPRMRATVEAVADGLTDEAGFVFRYVNADGLSGAEGTFTICTFWLVQCLAMLGDDRRARALFERVVAHANDVGLFAEEIDAATGAQLGNFPQAFTHIGLVNAAWAIAEHA